MSAVRHAPVGATRRRRLLWMALRLLRIGSSQIVTRAGHGPGTPATKRDTPWVQLCLERCRGRTRQY